MIKRVALVTGLSFLSLLSVVVTTSAGHTSQRAIVATSVMEVAAEAAHGAASNDTMFYACDDGSSMMNVVRVRDAKQLTDCHSLSVSKNGEADGNRFESANRKVAGGVHADPFNGW
ncbi:hypothetical protein H8A99_19125 [Bradyrhizobium sp. Arg68]|uniref:hypothetical protein n=1 Tax=Bradyrhizobium ivorense TaxID=2511166 RepID=UPI001E31BFB0|nr:hypothetical protein [Bradyrhizobium ivorense]MCC8938526.1 hypothetical protein [Bradyrhizobium ivorense]